MRLFIALNLPKKERERIYRAVRSLRETDLPVRWLEVDHFHVTLKFLGEVRRERIPMVQEIMNRIAGSTRSFWTDLRGFGAFPTVRRPRIIWLSVGATAELRCLKQDLEWGLGDLGFAPETRAFHPHVTLGRADESGGAGAFRGLDEVLAKLRFSGNLRVHTLDLMRSHVSRRGATYSVMASARLAAS